MKAIMYHYVRPDDEKYPFFRHLHVDDFRRQLDYFEKEFGFVTKEQLRIALQTGQLCEGVILTFDDGFIDHARHVAPILAERGAWGLFYVPTAPYETRRLLDVHRIHLLLGRHGGAAVAEALTDLLVETDLSHDHVKEFRVETYRRQENDEATVYVKRVLNYYIAVEHRQRILDELMHVLFVDRVPVVEDVYLAPDDMRAMIDEGMVIGSHTSSHTVMSKLSVDEQEREIRGSFDVLDRVVGPGEFRTFCYPYGGFHTFNDETEELLSGFGCDFSFNVEPRDIEARDLAERPQALPRYDCNLFPHGSCR